MISTQRFSRKIKWCLFKTAKFHIMINESCFMPNFKKSPPNCTLHIDPWPSRQSEILSENKRKKSLGWTETCGCYEIIYADAQLRYSVSVSVSQSQLAAGRNSVWESVSEWLGAPLG